MESRNRNCVNCENALKTSQIHKNDGYKLLQCAFTHSCARTHPPARAHTHTHTNTDSVQGWFQLKNSTDLQFMRVSLYKQFRTSSVGGICQNKFKAIL
jgi:flavoprotein